MCAITGYLDKTGSGNAPVGAILLKMLLALGCRGPDSTGVAMYGSDGSSLILQIKLGEQSDLAVAEEILKRVKEAAHIREQSTTGAYLRLVVAANADVALLIEDIEAAEPGIVEVVSMGRHLELVKQVGGPKELEATFGISKFVGTHGIGHTRLSTESKVDLSHSQPFWAHGLPDVAAAHNGHITNYHKLRRIYEQRGVKFYTGNDSEIVGIYLRDRMAEGATFEEALRASTVDFDGAFCYVAATADALAFVKDPFGLKPLCVAETDAWVAIATEEIAMRHALTGEYRMYEPATSAVQVWQLY